MVSNLSRSRWAGGEPCVSDLLDKGDVQNLVGRLGLDNHHDCYLLELQYTMAFSTQLSARTLGKGMLAATVLTLLVSTAQAHEHHEDKIPEGEAISPDPLVRSLE